MRFSSYYRRIILIIISIHIILAGSIKGQDLHYASAKTFTGTWTGHAIKNYDGIGPKKMLSFTWRIHSIDNVQHKIELTEMAPFSDDSVDMVPKKVTVKGHTEGEDLVIELPVKSLNKNVTIKLKAEYFEENIWLNGILERKSNNEDSYMLKLIKISDDVSVYIRSKNKVKVEIESLPYTIEEKPDE